MTDDRDHDDEDAGPIEFGWECDLHHFNARDTKIVVLEFIRQGREKGLTHLRLVHGKGRSVVKKTALSLLDTHPDVASYHQDGPNWGATIVVLRTS